MVRISFGSGLNYLLLGTFVIAGCRGQKPLMLGKTLASDVGAARSLEQLDVDHNGVVDDRDEEVFAALAQEAERSLVAFGHTLPAPRLYQGLQHDLLAALADAHWDGERFHLEPSLRREELEQTAIEAAWAAKQVRVARLGRGSERSLYHVGQRWFGTWGDETLDAEDLCQIGSSTDFSPWDRYGIEKVAVFDIDKTLWSRSVINAFLAVFLDQQLPRQEANPRLRAFLKHKNIQGVDENSVLVNAALLRRYSQDSSLPDGERIDAKSLFFETVALLRGVSVDDVERAARRALVSGAPNHPPMVDYFYDYGPCSVPEAIDALRTSGFRIFLLSSTLDVLAQATGDVLGLPRSQVIGSPLEQREGRYTGNVIASTYAHKGAITRAWLPAPPTFAFGDSASSDFPMMLEAFGAAFMINPDERMQMRDHHSAGGRFLAVTLEVAK